jgi:hypothetical protein
VRAKRHAVHCLQLVRAAVGPRLVLLDLARVQTEQLIQWARIHRQHPREHVSAQPLLLLGRSKTPVLRLSCADLQVDCVCRLRLLLLLVLILAIVPDQALLVLAHVVVVDSHMEKRDQGVVLMLDLWLHQVLQVAEMQAGRWLGSPLSVMLPPAPISWRSQDAALAARGTALGRTQDHHLDGVGLA